VLNRVERLGKIERENTEMLVRGQHHAYSAEQCLICAVPILIWSENAISTLLIVFKIDAHALLIVALLSFAVTTIHRPA